MVGLRPPSCFIQADGYAQVRIEFRHINHVLDGRKEAHVRHPTKSKTQLRVVDIYPQSSLSSRIASSRFRFWPLSLTGGSIRNCCSNSLGSIFCASEKDVLLLDVLRILGSQSDEFQIYNRDRNIP